MHGRVISISRGTGSNRRRMFALVDHGDIGDRPGIPPSPTRFELSCCDHDDEGEAWVAVRGPAVDEEFTGLAKLYGWNTELARLAQPTTTKAKTSEWSHDH